MRFIVWRTVCGFEATNPGIAAHDNCNISQIFTFSFRLWCDAVPFNYLAIFWRFQNWLVWGMEGMWVYNNLFQDWFANFSLCLWSAFVFDPNNWDLLWLLVVLSLSLFSLLLLWILFSDTHNQYNFIITYYSFICYLLEEDLLFSY